MSVPIISLSSYARSSMLNFNFFKTRTRVCSFEKRLKDVFGPKVVFGTDIILLKTSLEPKNPEYFPTTCLNRTSRFCNLWTYQPKAESRMSWNAEGTLPIQVVSTLRQVHSGMGLLWWRYFQWLELRAFYIRDILHGIPATDYHQIY